MRHPSTRALLEHWRGLSRNGAPPDRNELDPTAIAPTLQDIFILGRGPDRLWRYRVAGTRLSAYADRDLRGELFAGWWRPQDRLDVSRLVEGTAEDKVPVVGGVSGLSTRQELHDLEFLLLPLRHGGQDGLRMVGGFFPSPLSARTFDLRFEEIGVLSLRSLRAEDRMGSAFGQPRPDIERLVDQRRGLRLIEGGLS